MILMRSSLSIVSLYAMMMATAAFGQTALKITGSFASSDLSDGGSIQATFTCTGQPTCAGQYDLNITDGGCINSFHFNDTIIISGLDLSRPGPIQGSMTLRNAGYSDEIRPDRTCLIRPGTVRDKTVPYGGTWDGTNGTFALTGTESDGRSFSIPGTFKADVTPPPVFPMAVRSNIDSVQATASADIQFRPQDVGINASIFVFAVAPAARVKAGDDPKAISVGLARNNTKVGEKADACVISQLNSSGQLVAVTTAQLSAYLSGTLSASGASVTILNGTPTPNVAGATFYVGYGTSSQAMLNSGVFRNAVLVPGSSVCPMLPSLTALWWNPSESGWGLNLNHQGATLFGTLFTYDTTRAPLWLVMSGGLMQSDGVTYTGDLYRTTGPAFNAVPFTPIGAANVTKVGTMTVSFSDASAGSLQYSMNGVAVSKAIQRQVYGTRAANCLPTSDSRASSTNYQDLWWNPVESGWGLNVTHQDSTLFATLFTYDASGRDVWLVMSAGARQGDGSYLGDLYRTSGPAFDTVPFTSVTAATVGTMRLRFTDGNTGTLTYTYDGATVNKNIQRQVFASPVSACN